MDNISDQIVGTAPVTDAERNDGGRHGKLAGVPPGLMRAMRSVLRAAFKPLLLVVSLLALALVLEGATRTAYYLSSRRFIHPYLGETQKPLHRRVDYTPDGEAFEFTTNNYGFRGRQIPDRKPIEARYVFAIGGSTTACNEYPHERTWPGILEQRLQRLRANDDVTVYNAGMGSATSYRSLNLLLNVITGLQPDLVIVYEGVNDKGPFYPTSARYFREVGLGEDFLHRPSYFLYEVALHTRSAFVTKAAKSLYPPALPLREFAYHEKNYRDIAYIARGYQIPLIFMTQPTMPEAENNDGINRSTRDLGLELNVPVFDLAASMPRDYQHFLPDGVHYTERGNRWIAEQLGSWLVGQRLPR